MKCAGTWLNNALKRACPNAISMDHYPSLEEINLPNLVNAFFVRNPLDWYKSYFTFRRDHGWEMNQPDSGRELDQCVADTFDGFIQKCLDREPYLTYLYEFKMQGLADLVGHVENLENDLVSFLKVSEEPFDEQLLRTTPKANVSVDKPKWNKRLALDILDHEHEVIERYYSHFYSSYLPRIE
jgi:hypothetical protein